MDDPVVAARAVRVAPSVRRGPSRVAVAGAGLLVIVSLACFGSLPWTLGAAGLGGSARYRAQDLAARHLPPTWAPHAPDERARADGAPAIRVFGTDSLGRDLLARCLLGGAVSLGVGLSAALISVVIGSLYGAAAGYAGGRVDAAMMRIVDILYGLPYILLVVLLAVAADALVRRWSAGGGPSERTLITVNVVTLLVAIGGVSWLTMARVVRGQVLSLKAQPFMEAARVIGASPARQFFRHMLPNLVGPIVVYATLTTPQAMLQESFLSFLGIGVRPPLPSWGNLVAEGLAELNPVRPRWWLLLFPSLLLGATLLALNFVGEGLREAVDTRRART